MKNQGCNFKATKEYVGNLVGAVCARTRFGIQRHNPQTGGGNGDPGQDSGRGCN